MVLTAAKGNERAQKTLGQFWLGFPVCVTEFLFLVFGFFQGALC